MDQHYRNIVLTNHAKHRAIGRSISIQDIWETINHPQKQTDNQQPDTIKYEKQIRQRRVQVVATWLADQHKYLVLSVWVRGEEDQTDWIWQIITLLLVILWAVIKSIFGWWQRSRRHR